MNIKDKKLITGIVWLVFGVILGLLFVIMMLPLIGLLLF